MMDFEQRRAEVIRRGQARIRVRKRRKRILLGCVPLLLCAGLLGLGMFPSDAECEETAQPEVETLPDKVILAEIVFSSGETVRYSDPEKLDVLFSLLESITEEMVEDPAAEETAEEDPTGADRAVSCSIRLIDGQGRELAYHLQNGILTVRDTGECFALSQVQLDVLLAALGVTE